MIAAVDGPSMTELLAVAACVFGIITLAFVLLLLQRKHKIQYSPLTTAHAPAVHASADLDLHTTDEIKQRGLSCGKPECQDCERSCSHYMALLSYLEDFLAKPHADVGRTGPVCPFVPLAMKKQTVLVGMVRTTTADSASSVEEMMQLMRRLRDRFLQLPPTTGRLKLYKAMVVGFPDIADEDAPMLIDQVQHRLKSEFTKCGMMIGEFHRLNMTSGLRNPAFYPLQTPIPTLAIRFMVPTDVLFLKHDAKFLKAYLSVIPDIESNAGCRAEAKQALLAIPAK